MLENALGWSGVTELLAGDREKDRRRRTERSEKLQKYKEIAVSDCNPRK